MLMVFPKAWVAWILFIPKKKEREQSYSSRKRKVVAVGCIHGQDTSQKASIRNGKREAGSVTPNQNDSYLHQ